MISTTDYQTVGTIGNHVRDAAGIRCNYGKPAGERFQNRKRLVVDLGSIQIDIGCLILGGDVLGVNASDKLRLAQG
jgi:hypothetical protein